MVGLVVRLQGGRGDSETSSRMMMIGSKEGAEQGSVPYKHRALGLVTALFLQSTAYNYTAL